MIIPLSILSLSAAAEVALYWGQSSAGSDQTLGWYCSNASGDIYILSFIDQFGLGNPTSLNIAGQSGPISTLSIPSIGEDIKTCQQKGKKILLSLGGALGNYGFNSDSNAEEVATELWNAFGGGSGVNRPFGDAKIDGFDLDGENAMYASEYIVFINKMRELYTNDTSKQYYTSAAPQCPFPDATSGQAIAGSYMDFLFIQFYNNYCSMTGNNFNFDTWQDFASTKSPNPNVKLFAGLAGSLTAAGSGYATLDQVKARLQELQRSANFAGFMVWDASQANKQEFDGKPLAEQLESLGGATSPVGTSQTTRSASVAVTAITSAARVTTATTHSEFAESSTTTTTPSSPAESTTSYVWWTPHTGPWWIPHTGPWWTPDAATTTNSPESTSMSVSSSSSYSSSYLSSTSTSTSTPTVVSIHSAVSIVPVKSSVLAKLSAPTDSSTDVIASSTLRSSVAMSSVSAVSSAAVIPSSAAVSSAPTASRVESSAPAWSSSMSSSALSSSWVASYSAETPELSSSSSVPVAIESKSLSSSIPYQEATTPASVNNGLWTSSSAQETASSSSDSEYAPSSIKETFLTSTSSAADQQTSSFIESSLEPATSRTTPLAPTSGASVIKVSAVVTDSAAPAVTVVATQPNPKASPKVSTSPDCMPRKTSLVDTGYNGPSEITSNGEIYVFRTTTNYQTITVWLRRA